MKSPYTKKERENACEVERMKGKDYVVLAQVGHDLDVALVVPLSETSMDGRGYLSTPILVHRYNENTHEHEFSKRGYYNGDVKAARYKSVNGSPCRGSWHVFDLKKS